MSENAELILRTVEGLFWIAIFGILIKYRKAWLSPFRNQWKRLHDTNPVAFWVFAILPAFGFAAMVTWIVLSAPSLSAG